MNRRSFLKSSTLASSSLMVPKFVTACQGVTLPDSRSARILVIIQLSGGNDGLNTFVPYRNDNYYKLRPSLGLRRDEILEVSDQLAFNLSFRPLTSLLEKDQMCVVNNVGYPNPDRSHFRSMDIWQTASGSDEYPGTGWLGRYLDSDCAGCSTPYHAVELDDHLSIALIGNERRGFAMRDPNGLRRTIQNPVFQRLVARNEKHNNEQVDYLYKTLIDSHQSANYLYRQARMHQSSVQYPEHTFGHQLKMVSELITAETDTRIYYLSLSGFDTHANQKRRHLQLLNVYAQGVKAFCDDLKANGLFNDTLILTFSEFGRRVKENGSSGTDHGTANNVTIMSGSLKKSGFINEGPDLAVLNEGDLVHSVDFRRIYSEILAKWLNANEVEILNQKFEHLNFI